MKNKRIKGCFSWGIGLFCLFLLGCSQNGLEWKEEPEAEVTSEEETEAAETAQEGESQPTEVVSEAEIKSSIWVHVIGEVHHPGVYELEEGSRLWEAVLAAGGVTPEGDENYLNQAQLLSDGMKITIPSRSQTAEWSVQAKPSQLLEYSGTGNTAEQDKGVDLNTADKAALCTLPGIGESRAESILAYREKHGPFTCIEDIMKVSGIKEAAFEKIKDRIRVSGN